MAAKLAMVTVIFTPKRSLPSGSPEFGWLEKLLSFSLIAPQPTLSIAVPRFERPR